MDVSQQLHGALADRYRIEREIGAGGMATVYLAEDLKHHRRVALKVLRPELGAVLGPERFLSEINVTANLQHPHLLPLFDSGEVEGLLFYVMPYIEGESLRHRLERERQLPVDEAVRMAVSIASALDYAHRHGVIHRDLKPENILLHDGQPLVTDFGIALAVSNAGGARVTQTGLSLGTPQYMSPEQATGDRVIDARSDVYSLAAMLFEMLTGEAPHSAGTTQGIIAKLLTEKPPSVRTYRESVPEHVDAAVQCALAKLAADRFASAADFAAALTGERALAHRRVVDATNGVVETKPRLRRRLAAVLLGVGVLAGAAFMAAVSREPGMARRVPALLVLDMGDSAQFQSQSGVSVAISRRGTHVAFTGQYGGTSGILLRTLDGDSVRLVRGTAGGITPVFSPDGAWLAFSADGRIFKVPLEGGTRVLLAESGNHAIDWPGDGHVYFHGSGISRVPEDGGDVEVVATPDSTKGHQLYRWLSLLPGHRYALVTLYRTGTDLSNGEVGVMRMRDGKVTELDVRGTSPRYAPTGHIVFGREDGSVYAAPFSLRRRRVTGPAVRVAEQVNMGSGGKVDIGFSENGTFVVGRGELMGRQVHVVSRDGTGRAISREELDYSTPRASPDGRRIALGIRGDDGSDVWVLDVATGGLTRLTTNTGDNAPAWTPDGKSVAYIFGTADSAIYSQSWDGSGAPVRVAGTPWVSEIGYSAARRLLVLRTSAAQGAARRDILVMPLDSPGTARPFLATAADERNPDISPDGSLIAYASDETGRHEVYVRPYPGPGARVKVSQTGGTEPIWSRDGKELFYRSPTHVMAVALARTPELAVASETPLFRDSYSRASIRQWDVLPNGEFVMIDRSPSLGDVHVVINWDERMRSQHR